MLTRLGGAPTRTLMLVAALLAVLGGVLLGLGLAGPPPIPVDAVRPVAAGTPVEVGDDGFSLWSTDADAWQTAVCTADGTPLLRPVSAWSITVAGTTYHEVARSPRALLAGSYPVECTPAQTLYAGPHADRTAPSPLRGPVGVLAGSVLLALALLTGVVALVAHRRRRRLESWRVPAHRLDPSLRERDGEADPPGSADETREDEVRGETEPAVAPDPEDEPSFESRRSRNEHLRGTRRGRWGRRGGD